MIPNVTVFYWDGDNHVVLPVVRVETRSWNNEAIVEVSRTPQQPVKVPEHVEVVKELLDALLAAQHELRSYQQVFRDNDCSELMAQIDAAIARATNESNHEGGPR